MVCEKSGIKQYHFFGLKRLRDRTQTEKKKDSKCSGMTLRQLTAPQTSPRCG